MVIVESNESNVMCDIYFEQFQFFSLFITVVFIDMIVIFLSYSNNNVLVLVFLLLFFSKLKKKKKKRSGNGSVGQFEKMSKAVVR